MRMVSSFAFLTASLVVGCSLQGTTKSSKFPLEKGTTRVYNTNDIQTDYFMLSYDLSLSLHKSWCWSPIDLKNPNHKEIVDCEFVGKRMVTNEGIYQTPAGRFEVCYELTDFFNNGNIIHWFCEGVGVVFRKFDHAGTRFGFEQTLLNYSIGVPE